MARIGSEFEIEVTDGEKIYVFILDNGSKIRVTHKGDHVYVNTFPGAMAIKPQSGNAVEIFEVSISRKDRQVLTGQQFDEYYGPGQEDNGGKVPDKPLTYDQHKAIMGKIE